MDRSLTGAGKLSRKLLTILIMAAMPLSGYAVAQSASTGPNLVYIEQVGSSNLINIEQVGGTNSVGGVTGTVSVDSAGVTTLTPGAASSINYGTVTGSNNQLALIQHGNNNSAQYNIKGSYNIYQSTVTGNDNQTNLTMGSTTVNTTNSNVIETVTGNSNTVIQNVVGDRIMSTLSINGSNNQVTNDLQSTNGTVMNTIQGNFNVVNSQQSDSAGAVGHQLVLNTVGDYNSIRTQQQGFNDTTVNISTLGNHNTITVRSSSAPIVSPMTAIAR